jgi:hypothetical protein
MSRKTPSLLTGVVFLTSSPSAAAGLGAETRLWVACAVAWFRASFCACQARHYSFVGLSEGAYGAPGDFAPKPGVDTYPRTRAFSDCRIPQPNWKPWLRVRYTLRAQAACSVRCSASNGSAFFQIFSVMAAILRASVSRAISDRAKPNASLPRRSRLAMQPDWDKPTPGASADRCYRSSALSHRSHTQLVALSRV